MSLEHSEVNENNLKKIVVNLGIFGVKHYSTKIYMEIFSSTKIYMEILHRYTNSSNLYGNI